MLARTNGPEPDLVPGWVRSFVLAYSGHWTAVRTYALIGNHRRTTLAAPPSKLLVMRPNQKAGRLLGHGAKYLSIANDAEVLKCSLGRQVTRQASSVRVLGLAVQPYSKRTV